MTDFVADQLRVRIYENRAAMGEDAAKMAADSINLLLKRKETVNIIFAAAASQNEFLESFIKQDIDWQRVQAFHMDEYTGLRADAVQGFGNFLREHLFDRVPLLAAYCIDGQAASPENECVRYAGLLRQYPPDIVCMGIGENGHIAFNDPPGVLPEWPGH